MKYVCVTVPKLVFDYLKGEKEKIAVAGVATDETEAKKLATKVNQDLKKVEKFLGQSIGRKVMLVELDEVDLDE